MFTYICAWKRGHPFIVLSFLKTRTSRGILYVRPPTIKAYISLYSVRELSYEQNKSYPSKHSLLSCSSTFISAVFTKRGTGTGWRHVGVEFEFWDINKNEGATRSWMKIQVFWQTTPCRLIKSYLLPVQLVVWTLDHRENAGSKVLRNHLIGRLIPENMNVHQHGWELHNSLYHLRFIIRLLGCGVLQTLHSQQGAAVRTPVGRKELRSDCCKRN